MATSMIACRWNWCARTFSDADSRAAHIEQDHIATAVPVKRKDVALLRRAEDGVSFQESVIPRAWLSETEGSQSQPHEAPNRVERAVMTDLVAHTIVAPTAQIPPPARTPNQTQRPRSGASTPMHTPRPSIPEGMRQMTFAQMRGTPSPAPSQIPSSPGTTAIIKNMRQKMLHPVTPRRSMPVSPRATSHSPYPKQSPSKVTPKGRGILPYTYLTPPMGDVGSDAGMDNHDDSMEIVETQLMSYHDAEHDLAVKSTLSALQSQWHPQSQLPFDNSASYPVSTVNPKQLHAPLSFGADSQPMIEEGESPYVGNSISPVKAVMPSTPKASQRQATPTSAPPPPSPSTLDVSNITKTDSQESMLRTPSRTGRAPPRAFQSSPPRLSPLPAAGTAGLGQSGSQAESQGTDMYAGELPFDSGYGYGYGEGHGELQPLQTQALGSSYDSSSWSQG